MPTTIASKEHVMIEFNIWEASNMFFDSNYGRDILADVLSLAALHTNFMQVRQCNGSAAKETSCHHSAAPGFPSRER
jgi:hypothetical protein